MKPKIMKPKTEGLRMGDTTALATTEYRGPRPLEQLGGNEGLLLSDIAEAIGAKHAELRQKMERSFVAVCNHLKLQTVAFATHHPRSGRPFQTYAMDTAAAKAFLAKWDSPKGWDYLGYLLKCETVVEQKVPKLLDALKSENERLAGLLAQATKPKITRRKGEMRIKVWEIVRTKSPIFGLVHEDLVQVSRPYRELTDSEKSVWQARHRQSVMTGLSKAQSKALVHLSLVPSCGLISSHNEDKKQ